VRNSYQTCKEFVGEISPFLLFEMEYHRLFYIVENHKNDNFYSEINPASPMASIGLLAHFEAFCKHQFAAIVNLMPSLIPPFSSKRSEPKIEFSTIASFEGKFENNIGFILSEIYDFGTAKSINGIFRDLLLITPFDKKEIATFDSIVFRRNLLVHHAGYYTSQYSKRSTSSVEMLQKAFKETVKIDTDEFGEISEFLFEMAKKITRVSVDAFKKHADFNLIEKNNEKVVVVYEMLQGIYDTLEE
jgi:hypothetical protein